MEFLLFIPLTLFLVIILPLWLILHYGTRRGGQGLSGEDQRRLMDLWHRAERLDERIMHLETILDREAPGWRGRQ